MLTMKWTIGGKDRLDGTVMGGIDWCWWIKPLVVGICRIVELWEDTDGGELNYKE